MPLSGTGKTALSPRSCRAGEAACTTTLRRSRVGHCFGIRVKLLRPACFLNPSNWTGLKSGLLGCSRMRKKLDKKSSGPDGWDLPAFFLSRPKPGPGSHKNSGTRTFSPTQLKKISHKNVWPQQNFLENFFKNFVQKDPVRKRPVGSHRK
jgi:hypothetical protein